MSDLNLGRYSDLDFGGSAGGLDLDSVPEIDVSLTFKQLVNDVACLSDDIATKLDLVEGSLLDLTLVQHKMSETESTTLNALIATIESLKKDLQLFTDSKALLDSGDDLAPMMNRKELGDMDHQTLLNRNKEIAKNMNSELVKETYKDRNFSELSKTENKIFSKQAEDNAENAHDGMKKIADTLISKAGEKNNETNTTDDTTNNN